MSFTLWGLLSKAQDNPQTIDEAIADAIAVHNDDPTAHLGTGRSLEAHKTNEILDHVAGSVVSDKKSYKEQNFSAYPADFVDWNKTGNNGWTLQWPIFYNYVGNSINEYFKLENKNDYIDPFLFKNANINFSWVLRIYQPQFSVGFIGLSQYYETTNSYRCFVGFVQTNGVYTAKYDVPYSGGREVYTSPSFTLDESDFHFFFVNYIASENTYYFYVDGELVGQYTPTHTAQQYQGLATVYMKATVADYTDVHFKSFDYNILP